MRRDRASWIEVLAGSAAVLLVWRRAVPWDQSVRPTAEPDIYAPPSSSGWVLVFAVAVAAAFWLGWRGRPASVTFFLLPLIALASWRAMMAEVIGANMWPLGTIFQGLPFAAICAAVALWASLLRKKRREGSP